jgi:hypothetical protein
MRQIRDGYRGVHVLFRLNADLLLFAVALVVALLAAGFLSSL